MTDDKTVTMSKDHDTNQISDTIKEEHDDAATASEPESLERWNSSRTNIFRYLSALFSFIVMGMNDAAYGALIPYVLIVSKLETYYSVNYTVISLVFLAPFVGYTIAAFLNNKIHMNFGQLGVAVIGPSCKIVCYAVTCAHPPYPVLPFIFMIAGFGNGLEDGGWNAWIGNMEKANELLGFLHGCYGLGATISPLIATAMVAKANLPWFKFYYLMICLAVIEFILCVSSFRKATAAVHRAVDPPQSSTLTSSDSSEVVPESSRTTDALRNPVTWICALFLLCYVGVEVSLGGWLVTFMLRVRHGDAFDSGMVVVGFWLGITCGRIVLGFVTGRIGEKLAIACYLVISLALELLFWLIPNFISSAIFAGWLGFFLGPLFPAAIVVATKLLPRRLHVSAIGFAAAFGGGGAAVFPFAVGAIAQAKGVQVLQPFALALLVANLALWCLLPGGFRKKGLEEVQRRREEGSAGAVEEGKANGISGGVQKLRQKLGFAM